MRGNNKKIDTSVNNYVKKLIDVLISLRGNYLRCQMRTMTLIKKKKNNLERREKEIKT